MARVFDEETGAVVDVDPEEARTGFVQGRYSFPESRPVTFVAHDGRAFELDPTSPDFQQTLLSPQFRIASEQERVAAEAEARSGDAPVQTAVEGVAREATLGLSDLALMAAGDIADPGGGAGLRRVRQGLEERRELNPTAAGIGEVAGAILPALATGGTSLAARAAGALPAGLAARAGLGIEQAVAGSLAGLAERGVAGRLAQRAVSSAAGGAVEGAVFEGRRVLTESMLGDQELTGEQLAAAMGMGALIGGVGSGLVTGSATLAGAGFRRLNDGARDALGGFWRQAEGTELRPGVVDAVFDSLGRRAGTGLPAEEQAFVRGALGATPEGRRIRDVIRQGDAPISEAVPRLRRILDEDEEIARSVQDFAIGSLKRAPIERRINDLSPEMAAAARETIGEIDRFADFIGSRPGMFAGAGFAERQLRGLFDEFSFAIEKGIERGGREGAADVFLALDMAKRRLGRITKRTTRDRLVHEEFDALYNKLRTHLEAEDLYGDAAHIQREVNAAWAPFLANSGQFRGKFLAKAGEQEGFIDLYSADPRALESFLRQVGTEGAALDEEIFRRHIASRQQLSDTIAKHFDVPEELTQAVTQSRRNVDALAKELEHIDAVVKTSNQFRRLRELVQQRSQLVPGGIGAAIGGGLFGPVGAAAGAALGGAIVRPDQAILTLAQIEAVRGNLRSQMRSQVREALRRSLPSREAVRTGVQAAKRVATVQVSLAAFDEKVEQVLGFTSSPEQATERVSSRTERIAEAAPNVHGHMASAVQRAAAFLRARIPPAAVPAPSIIPNLPRPRPSDTEIAQFMRYVRAVEDPRTVLEDLGDGQLTPEAVEALREVYPRMYGDLVQTVMEQLSETRGTVTYETRIRLGLLLGAPTDPSLDPGFVARMQQSAPAPAQPPPQAATRFEALNVSGAHLSETQRLEQRRTA